MRPHALPTPRHPPRSACRPCSCQARQQPRSLSAGRGLPGQPSSPTGNSGAAFSHQLTETLLFPDTPERSGTRASAVRAGAEDRVTGWPRAPVQGIEWFNSVNRPGHPWGSSYQPPILQGRTRGPRVGGGPPQASTGRGTSCRLSTRAWRSATAFPAPSSPHAENACRPSACYWSGQGVLAVQTGFEAGL